MNNLLKILCLSLILSIFLSGCVTQTGPGTVKKDFDPSKAAQNRVSLGLTYLKNGNFSQAKYNLDKALEFAPRSADANYAMAYYYQNVGELEQAEESYQYAMDLEPRNADIANSYGAFLCQNGNYDKAKEYFLKAVNTSNYISSAQTYENLALCSQSQGRPEDAIQYFRSAVNHQPSRANSLYLLTQALVDAQQWREARDVLKRYEKVSQVSAQSLSMAAKIEKGLGNHSVAKGYADMLLKLYPKHPATLAILNDQTQSVAINQPTQPSGRKSLKKKTLKQKPQPAQVPVESTSSAEAEVKVAEKRVKVESTQVEETAPSTKKNAELARADATVSAPNDKQENTKTEEENQLPVEAAADGEESISTHAFHVVSKGENLYRISLLYNIRMQRLVEWNGLADASAIYNGMKLSLVAPNPVE